MEVYSLTSVGRALAHGIRNPSNTKWKIIYFLSRRESATKEQILSYVPDATALTLAELKGKHIIQDETQVNI